MELSVYQPLLFLESLVLFVVPAPLTPRDLGIWTEVQGQDGEWLTHRFPFSTLERLGVGEGDTHRGRTVVYTSRVGSRPDTMPRFVSLLGSYSDSRVSVSGRYSNPVRCLCTRLTNRVLRVNTLGK